MTITEQTTVIFLSAAANLSQEVFPEERRRCVTLQLAAGGRGRRLRMYRLHRATSVMVRPFDPVAPKLRQEDERKGTFSAQHLSQSAE